MSDRFRLYAHHREELQVLSERLHYDIDDILAAVQEVGFDEDEVEEYIRDRHDRSLDFPG